MRFESIIAKCLRVLGGDSVLIGAVALLFHGYVRATVDLDFIVRVDQEGWLEDLKERSKKEGLLIEQLTGDFLRLADRNKTVRADCILVTKGTEGSWYYERVIQRALVREDLGFPLKVASLEDLLVLKVLSFRPKDRQDVLAVLSNPELSSRLDKGYIERTLREISEGIGRDILEEWQKLLEGSSSPNP